MRKQHRLKLDGFRGQAIRDKNGVHLLSRNGKDFSKKFPQVFAALAEALPLGTAVDGELVAFDESGRPSFNAIQNADADTNVVFFAFDVLVNRWRDVKQLPLSERLLLLQSTVVPSERVQLSEHFAGPMSRFVAAVRKMSGEGVVAKRLASRYEPGKRSGAWAKKRLNIGQEFIIGGFTPGSNGIDALVVDFYNGKALMYAARVRAGLVPATRRDLYSRLKPFIVDKCPFANLPEAKSGRWGQGLTAAKMRECIWVKPTLVANFEFLEWTDTTHGDPRHDGATLVILKVINEGRRPVRITHIGAWCLYPTNPFVCMDTQPELEHEIKEGEYIMTFLNQSDVDLATIDFWQAIDSTGRVYKLRQASWLKHWQSEHQRKLRNKLEA